MTQRTRPPRTPCAACGTRHQHTSGLCHLCRRGRSTKQFYEREIALTGGKWVHKGSIQVWTGDRPADEPDSPPDLIETLERTLSEPAREKLDPAFCACGCWLLSADEDCPACMARTEWLPWAIGAETRHNRLTYGRAA